MEKPPRILVGVDFSPASQCAVAEGHRLARAMGAQVDFAHISPLPPSAPELPPLELETATLAAARSSLAELEENARREGIPAATHFGVGSPVFGLLDFIDRLQPMVVIVGSHGRTALMRLLVGSVAESLIRRSPVPVLVVPAPGRHRQVAPSDAAWSCRDCGHILGRHESTSSCSGCGAEPAQWIAAPLSSEPADAGVAAVSDEEREELPSAQRNDPAGLFATSPPGCEGTDINPELRVRY
jgi:nucleotide-binding universal stress UspA family protein